MAMLAAVVVFAIDHSGYTAVMSSWNPALLLIYLTGAF